MAWYQAGDKPLFENNDGLFCWGIYVPLKLKGLTIQVL